MLSATLIVLVLFGTNAEPSSGGAAQVEKLGSACYAEREATKSLETCGHEPLMLNPRQLISTHEKGHE
jgi:hypothetical protein